jgi:hypothetical protein
MAYEFEPGEPKPVETGIYGDYIVDFDLGVDTEAAEQVHMSVALYEDDDTGSDPFGLVFGIRRTSTSTGETSLPAFDHATVGRYVPKERREFTMLLVLRSIRMLVNQVNPDTIFMETFEGGLPVEAMAKYNRISNYLGILGYIQTFYNHSGNDLKDSWLFTKSP